MPKFAMVTGVCLVLVGAISYVATGASSITALIPSFFGIALFVLGVLARKPERLKLMMHVAVVVALLGFMGSVQGIPAMMSMLAGAETERPAAAIARSFMALITLVFVVAAVRSFIAARRARKVAA